MRDWPHLLITIISLTGSALVISYFLHYHRSEILVDVGLALQLAMTILYFFLPKARAHLRKDI